MSGPCLSSSVTDHPLRPATRRRLGKPLPYQLADRPRAHPEVRGLKGPRFDPQEMPLGITYGIRPPFGGLSPASGQVAHVLLTRSPLDLPKQALLSLVRLACLIHAASVRSEPESNSPKRKYVVSAGKPAPTNILTGIRVPTFKHPVYRAPHRFKRAARNVQISFFNFHSISR